MEGGLQDGTMPPKEESEASTKSEPGHYTSLPKAQSTQSALTHLALEIFPIRIEGKAKTACRYYTDIYAPTTFRRLELEGVGEDLSLLRHYIPLILSNHVSFAGMLANAMLQFDLMDRPHHGPSPQAKGIYDVTIRLFRQYLQSTTDKVSDLVICTMLFLATFDNLTLNYDSAWIHLRAIEEAIARRGGPQRLEFDGWLATVTDSFITHAECHRAIVSHPGTAAPKVRSLDRPVHPFSPALCAQIARLPQAFEEFCINQRPVAAVIDVLSDIAAWVAAVKATASEDGREHLFVDSALLEANLNNATRCFELLQSADLPLQDQLVLMALQAYCSLVDSSERGRFLNLAYLQIHAGLLPSTFCFPGASHPQSHEAEWLTWVGMMMLTSSHTNDLTWSLGMRILDHQGLKQSWMQKIRICEKFFWNERFSYQVLRKKHFTSKSPNTFG
ncbi:uncharacterized protein Z520_04606 [Fonsecaea multimorphosa CBS 102226]|uniref:Transcription factor domain-containing protein n=1 Tax=Fonsecaea multimorphosa CBS 102226 TaxID=1442371 RepID=A0A0D2KTB1_9EURO|nr:uncharacterized protein Z520_04606 [Fonsecaea multimorphosa CBS 102226]KIX99968.1 hypothetical protein Z520_04606 [Fonsecaea multimorphosa CBS 102226]OAL26183.1 hypothetical protein AYO22_04361 [Fonsecaea multimorphosa]